MNTSSHSPENKTNAEISLLYDVISHYVIDAQIGSIGVCEREYAKKNLAYFSSICDEKDIVIFDRGYPSRDMIATLTGMGCKYLICSANGGLPPAIKRRRYYNSFKKAA